MGDVAGFGGTGGGGGGVGLGKGAGGIGGGGVGFGSGSGMGFDAGGEAETFTGSGVDADMGAISFAGVGVLSVAGSGQGLGDPLQVGLILWFFMDFSSVARSVFGWGVFRSLGIGLESVFMVSALSCEYDVDDGNSPLINLVKNSILTNAIAGFPPLVNTYIPLVCFSTSATKREKLSLASVNGTILSIGTFNIVPSNSFGI